MPASRHWTDLTTLDFARADMAEVVAVLPVAAVEQHGPHLPLGTDAFIMDAYLGRVVASMPDEMAVRLLPTQSCGCSVEHGDFPGTLSLTATAALAAWSDIARSVARTGCRKLVVVTSHGGNSALLDVLAHQLRAELGMLVVPVSWQRFGYPEGLFDEAERTHGIHGGAIETSLMLAIQPELVRMDKAQDAVPRTVAMAEDFAWLRAGRPVGFGWMARDLSPSGVAGDATAATASKGDACLAHGAAAFVALLRDVAAFDIGAFAPVEARG